MEEKKYPTVDRTPHAEPPPLERDARAPRAEQGKERGPLWVKTPPPGVELRAFLRIMLGG